MNPQTEQSTMNLMNKIALIAILVLVIGFTGFYSFLKFGILNDMLSKSSDTKTEQPVLSESDKLDLLSSIDSDSADVDERSRLEMIRNMSVESNLDIKDRNTILDSLK